MKPRKTLSVYVLLVGVMGLSIVGGILAFQIFSASVKSQLTQAQRDAVKPIDGTISQTIVDNLQQRTVITNAELSALSSPTAVPSLAIVETPVEATLSATSSAIPLETPSVEQITPIQ